MRDDAAAAPHRERRRRRRSTSASSASPIGNGATRAADDLLGARLRAGRRLHRRRRATGSCSTSTPTRSPAHLAARLGAAALVIAGGTPACSTTRAHDRAARRAGIARLIKAGTATGDGREARRPAARRCDTASATCVIVNGRDRRGSTTAGAAAGDAASCPGRCTQVVPMTTMTIRRRSQAREARHVLQTYTRQPVVFVRGSGVAPVRRRRPRVSRPAVRASASRRSATRIPGLAARDRRAGGDADPHVEPVLPPAAGPARGAPGAAVGPAARVLLQQRHRSGRSVPEVRAALLVHAGRSRAHRVRRPRTSRSTAGRWARCRSRTTSTTARRSSRCWPASRSCRPTTAPRSPPRSPTARPRSSPSRFRAKAASGR